MVEDADGVPQRTSVYAATQKEALTKGKQLEEQYRKGLVAKRDGRTLGEFAREWLKRKSSSGKAKNTMTNYTVQVGYITDLLGEMRLQAIKPTHIRKLLDNLTEKGFAASTQHKVLERLRMMFKEAMRLELIFKNPAENISVEVAKGEPVGKALEPHQIEALLEACRKPETPTKKAQTPNKSPMELFFRLVLGCGLRKGEALALTWADVDFKRAELSITKNWTGSGKGHLSAPKTRKSRRVIPLPQGLLARLEAEYKSLLGDYTAYQLKTAYLFGLTKPFDTQSPNHALARILERMEKARLEREKETGIKEEPFPRIRIHDLRHTYGSLALAKGMPLEVVSERMGHSNPTITLGIYRHVLEYERRGHVFDLEEMIQPQTRPRAQA